ncbi:hypothetical protein ABMA28_001979 [Loxostege sticticalis]|uniref:Reverse transcriptase domain-containing protein n=1 Tax=Loxostege sticticalis TaxID=481309 RepID=A0ABD0T202_LOXSC
MDKNDISIYYQNCRGLRTKLHTLYMNILTQSYDIIILTETWLHADITDNEFIDNRYRVFRADRDLCATGRRDGGGVLIAIRRALCSGGCALAAAAPPLPPVIDQLLIELKVAKRSFYIGAVYIPPKQCHEVYLNYLNMIQNKFLDHNTSSTTDFFIVGDFNLPNLLWISNETYGQSPSNHDFNQSHIHVKNFMTVLNCYQLNYLKNENGRILDLFITDKTDCELSSVSNPLLPIDKHHPPFCVSVASEVNHGYIRLKPYLAYCYKKVNYDIIRQELASIDWDDLFSNKKAEEAVSLFYEKIYSIIEAHVPKRKIASSSYPTWFTPELINLFNKKNRAWIKMKKYKNQSDYNLFSIYRKQFKSLSDKCYKSYIAKVETSIKDNIKYFWKYMSQRRKTSDIPSSVQYEGSIARSPEESCDLFSRFFHSVFGPSYVPVDLTEDDLGLLEQNTPDLIIHDIKVTRLQVRKALQMLDTSKGAGTDNIPGTFFKETAREIDLPLCYLYNKCLSEGTFPGIWKSARIVPIHKDGAKTNVVNYRPISILPILSKVFERLVHDAIYPHLHNGILQEQHGFVKRRSTITNLLIYTSDLFNALDNNTQTDCIYTDFRKAFDAVDHRILLEKIAYNGIRGNLWRWFKSYISNRTQRVVIKGSESEVTNVTSGVPQGSILGPLLFILFINDVKNCFKNSRFLLYADDLKIYRCIKGDEDHRLLQEDLGRFYHYCSLNRLQLNLNKCKTITFTKKQKISNFNYSFNGTDIARVNHIRDLGIILDDKLHLDIHIQNIIAKAFKMYGLVMRASVEFRSALTFIHLFKSLVRPQLEYGVSIWNPLYEKYNHGIEMVQKKFLRRINYKCHSKRLSYVLLLKKYKLMNLRSRRAQLDTKLLYDLCNNKYDCTNIINRISYSVPTRSFVRSLRPKPLFAVARCRTNAGIRSPLHRMADTYNKTFNKIDIFSSNSRSFNKQMVKILLEM